MLSDAELAAIRARLESAAPGPWGWWDMGDSSGGWDGADLVRHSGPGPLSSNRSWGMSREDHALDPDQTVLYFPEHTTVPGAEDATFIAHSRADIEGLLATVEALKAQIASVRAAIAPQP